MSSVLLDKLLGELVLVSAGRSPSSSPDVHVGSGLLDELALSGLEQRLLTLDTSLSCRDNDNQGQQRVERCSELQTRAQRKGEDSRNCQALSFLSFFNSRYRVLSIFLSRLVTSPFLSASDSLPTTSGAPSTSSPALT